MNFDSQWDHLWAIHTSWLRVHSLHVCSSACGARARPVEGLAELTPRAERTPIRAQRWRCRQSPLSWLWVKNRYPKWNLGKWKHGLKPAVRWWFKFDPYPAFKGHVKTGSNKGEPAPIMPAASWNPFVRTHTCFCVAWANPNLQNHQSIQHLTFCPPCHSADSAWPCLRPSLSEPLVRLKTTSLPAAQAIADSGTHSSSWTLMGRPVCGKQRVGQSTQGVSHSYRAGESFAALACRTHGPRQSVVSWLHSVQGSDHFFALTCHQVASLSGTTSPLNPRVFLRSLAMPRMKAQFSLVQSLHLCQILPHVVPLKPT